jgi:hypothetical protein
MNLPIRTVGDPLVPTMTVPVTVLQVMQKTACRT